jgi:hypothetical protein
MATAAAAQSTELEPRTALNKERARMVVVAAYGRQVSRERGSARAKLLDRLVDQLPHLPQATR